ncbi:MAG: biotin--[acetyl-CoA-carboxylase] ligase [Oscillospiraceae bacterium]|nr:biotin--[acetyl-CoA-carboxylase] ligase [Oscillospiraceae bacterium]
MEIEKIKRNLKTKHLGRNIAYFEMIESTQAKAKELAAQKIQTGTIVVTEKQTKGIGTHGRQWIAEENSNILMTLIIYPECNIAKLEGMTIDIAECLVDVFQELHGIAVKVKEPNDLIINNKKLGGILTETILEKEVVKNLFIGIGININQEEFPKELMDIATSLKKETNKTFIREEIIAEFLNRFEEILNSKL